MRLFLMLTLVGFLTSCGFEVVDTGHRGVKTRFGKVLGGTLDEGIHFYNPFTTDVTEMDVREKRLDLKTTAYSKDAQIVNVVYSLNFRPEKNVMHNFYQEVGKDWANIIIPQILEGAVKEEVGRQIAVELITNRQITVTAIKSLITERLKQKNIFLTNFEVTDLDFDDQFEAAVKRKVIAVEDAKTSKNLLEKAKNDKQIAITEAQAEAESMRIRANALKTNKSLIEYEAIQRWDGKLPRFMFGGGKGGGAVPFINVAPGN